MSISKQKKQQIIKKFGSSDKDTGSLEVQIAILTEDIEKLKPHFENNKKDNHSKRGFIAKIQKRKKYLAHLRDTDFESYKKLIAKLGLRK